MRKFSEQVNKILTEARVTRHGDLFVRVIPGVGHKVKKYYKDPECMILHREDGPAVEHGNPTQKPKYYLNGKQYTEAQWAIITNYKKTTGELPSAPDLQDMTDLLDI